MSFQETKRRRIADLLLAGVTPRKIAMTIGASVSAVYTVKDRIKLYSDVKIFTVDAVVNRRNNRYIAQARSEVKGIFRTKNPAQLMVFGIVTSDGKKDAFIFF